MDFAFDAQRRIAEDKAVGSLVRPDGSRVPIVTPEVAGEMIAAGKMIYAERLRAGARERAARVRANRRRHRDALARLEEAERRRLPPKVLSRRWRQMERAECSLLAAVADQAAP